MKHFTHEYANYLNATYIINDHVLVLYEYLDAMYTSSILPRSPECIHPSESMEAFVFSSSP